MRYLLSIDAFRGLEDGREATHGPVKIVGYELLETPRAAARKVPRVPLKAWFLGVRRRSMWN